jgi:putative tricarboxylic transport membrane protein
MEGEAPAEPKPNNQPKTEERHMANRMLAAFIIVLSGIYIYAAYRLPSLDIGDPLGPKIFPYLIGALAILSAIWLVVETATRERLAKTKASPESAGPATLHRPLAVAAVLGWMLLFYILFERLGFVIACAGFLMGLTTFFNRGRWLTNILVSLGFPLGVYIAFTKILGITLPTGFLPF